MGEEYDAAESAYHEGAHLEPPAIDEPVQWGVRDTAPKTDYRAQALKWAGPGREAMVDAIAVFLHHNESLHMHEDVGAECCTYCWLRAGKAVMALASAGLLPSAQAAG